MVQSLKSQLEHALVKRPETYSLEDSREQLLRYLRNRNRREQIACFAKRKRSSNSMSPTCR